MINDYYLIGIMGTLPSLLPIPRDTQPDRQTDEKRKREITGNKKRGGQRQRRESVIGRTNTVWVQRGSRDAKTGRLRKKGRAEGC